MAKFLKILTFVLLTLFISIGFIISHFSNAQDGENNVLVNKTPVSALINLENSTSSSEGSVYICPEATSLEEINPLCPGIIILNLGETVNGLTLTTIAYEGKEYYLVLGFKNGGGGEFGFVEKSIKNLNDYIQSLPDSAFKNNPKQRKNALKNKIEEVFTKIESQEYQDAINKLRNDIRAKVDGNEKAKNWIISQDAQEQICDVVDSLISFLRSLL